MKKPPSKPDPSESFGLAKALSTICRDATRLMIVSRDRDLTKMERFGLKSHLRGCRSCKRFEKQLGVVDVMLEQTMDVSTIDISEALDSKTRKRIRAKVMSRMA